MVEGGVPEGFRAAPTRERHFHVKGMTLVAQDLMLPWPRLRRMEPDHVINLWPSFDTKLEWQIEVAKQRFLDRLDLVLLAHGLEPFQWWVDMSPFALNDALAATLIAEPPGA